MVDEQPKIPAPFVRAFPCPQCDGWMKTFHNPSYGIGLAKHHYLRLCQKCDFATFIPEALVARYNESIRREPKPVAVSTGRKSWFGWRSK